MRGLAGLLPLSAAKPSFRHTPQTVHIVRRKSLHRRLNTGGLTNLYDEAQAPALQVRNVSESGIELKDGLVYASACILFGGQSFVWRVPAQPWVEWSSEAFEIFSVVSPKPELLLLGTGKSLLLPPPSIREYLRKAGISMDVMDTRNACSTFNLLSEEGRKVAAALLPL